MNAQVPQVDPNKFYTGEIIDNKDPDKRGRCKVRVMEVMDGFDDNFVPWAYPAMMSVFAGEAGGNLSIPKKGTTVRVKFIDGDVAQPEYYATQKVDHNLTREIKDDYIGSHVLLYDHEKDLAVIYQPNAGIRVYLQGSFVQISADGMITINHAGNTGIIQLKKEDIDAVAKNDITINGLNNVNLESKVVNIQGAEAVNIQGDRPDEVAVNGRALIDLLMYMAQMIDTKAYMTPGVCVGEVAARIPAILNEKIHYT